ncbi:MAG: hypothetical protein LR001_01975 [Clostridiales bacterium]|nr:hypothetical protein [Clostridiales bacterium]
MKLDKNDNEKENGAKKPTKYFSHKMGFYVILFFCISIVAVSAMWGNQQMRIT